MANPVFNNKENECTKTADGRTIFISRSMATCVPVIAETKDGKRYVLISQRGSGTPNYEYHYNLVCGYLDHNEDLVGAAKRELWEETGFDVDAVPNQNVVYPINQEAWSTKSKPDKGMQNVTVRFGFYFTCETKEDLPKLSNEYCEENEVIESIWVEHEDVMKIPAFVEGLDPKKQKVWAFNHFDVYREWMKKVEVFRPETKPLPAIVTMFLCAYIFMFFVANNNNIPLFGNEMLYVHILGGLASLSLFLEITKRYRRGKKIFKDLFSFKL